MKNIFLILFPYVPGLIIIGLFRKRIFLRRYENPLRCPIIFYTLFLSGINCFLIKYLFSILIFFYAHFHGFACCAGC